MRYLVILTLLMLSFSCSGQVDTTGLSSQELDVAIRVFKEHEIQKKIILEQEKAIASADSLLIIKDGIISVKDRDLKISNDIIELRDGQIVKLGEVNKLEIKVWRKKKKRAKVNGWWQGVVVGAVGVFLLIK